jgi:electron transfer flavoprotein beta subunit
MNIIICIKSVVLDAPDGRVVRLPETTGLNPFDRPALEIGLRLKEQQGGSVTVVTMGPDSAAYALYEAISMGADRAVLVSDPALAGSDTLATARVLSSAIKKLGSFDLVLFGARSSDSDTGQVGPQTAVLLDLPIVTGVCDVRCDDAGIAVERGADEFIETFQVSLPAALAAHATAVQPRDVKLLGIQNAFENVSIKKMNLMDLDLSKEVVGDSGSPTKIVSLNRVVRKKKCEFISGSVEEQADEIVRRIRDAGYLG